MWPRFKQATGLLIGNDRIVATVVALTPAGVKELRTQEIEVDEEGIRHALAQLTPRKAWLKGTVVAGLDARQVFFSTKPHAGSPISEVADMLPSTLASGSKFVSDSVLVKQRKQSYLRIGACGRDTAREVIAGLESVKPTQLKLVPAPLTLHDLAASRGRLPRRWHTIVRVLLDGNRGLAFLTHRKQVVAWRPFLVSENDVEGLASAVRAIRAYGRAELDLPDIDGVIVHADGDPESIRAACEETSGIETRTLPFVPLDAQTLTKSLALAGLKARTDVPDLLRRLKPPPSIRDIFPWGVAGLLGAAVLGTGMQLSDAADMAEMQTRRAIGQTRKDAKKAKVKVPQLRKRHKEMSLQMELVYRFIVKRVSWATILAAVPENIPPSVVLYGIQGRDSFTMPSNTKSKIKVLETKEISFMGRGRLGRGKAAPEEITDLLDALAQAEAIKSEFPRMDGANVIRKPGRLIDAVTFVAKCSKPKQ